MDVFAHTLWTNAVFSKKYPQDRKNRYIAAFFGVAPDLVGFTPAFLYMIFHGIRFSKAVAIYSNHWSFGFAREAYNYSHSLVMFLIVMVIVIVARRGRIYWPLLGWGFHILLDIPTHPDFFSTPFLFPLSNYRFTHGISWSHQTFMIVNYSLLAALYLYLVLRNRNKNKIIV
jgi:hypothetical protein